MPTDVLARLHDALGASVTTDPATLDATREDRSGWRSATPPLAVVHAASVDDVQAAMRIAHASGTPVVPAPRGTTGVPEACAMRMVARTSATDAACTTAIGTASLRQPERSSLVASSATTSVVTAAPSASWSRTRTACGIPQP